MEWTLSFSWFLNAISFFKCTSVGIRSKPSLFIIRFFILQQHEEHPAFTQYLSSILELTFFLLLWHSTKVKRDRKMYNTYNRTRTH